MTQYSRRDFLGRFGLGALGLAGALAQLGCGPSPEETRRKLNFVFILVDDLGWTDNTCYGSDFYETPNIDRLASQGMRFTNAYAACPVCSPSRAAILTGKYPARLNITDWIPGRKQWPAAKLLVPSFNQQLPNEEVTIAEMLKPAGYTSASTGKWHLGGEGFDPTTQGFDLNVAGTERGSPRSYFGPFDLPNLQGGDENQYLPDRLTTEALAFIEKNRDNPFFLYLPHFLVHIPLQAKKELIEKYEPKAAGRKLQNNATYAAMVESLDQNVGRVLTKLNELGIAENTVVFYTSDNGGLMYEGGRKDPVTSNRPLRAGKGHLYEGGIRVPLVVRWPGVVRAGAVSDVPVSGIDYFPTIRDIAGMPPDPSQTIDGVSLVPVLRQTGSLNRDALYWHYPHYSNQGGQPGAVIREGDWKLIEFYVDGHLELHNLAEDPSERNNLADKMPDKTADLHKKLKAWRESVNANMPQANPGYDPAKADQGLTGAKPESQ